MKILVTGGAGYIGSFMVKRLFDEGYEVIVIDSLERGHEKAIDKRASLIKADIGNGDLMEKVFNENKFYAVVHFAGYISMEESMKDPGLYFCKNATLGLELIEHAKKHNIRRFIFSSTAGIYGNPIEIPIPEDHPTNPTNPYGESKLMVEKILSWYQKIYSLNFVTLRYFNAAGATLDASLGERHSPETHIIPLAIQAALNGSDFNLYGQDYNTPDGTCIRDYIHVVDLIEAHILALEKLKSEKGGFFYNVGTGKGYSNREVIDMVKKVSGVNFKVVVEKRRPGDTEALVADSTRIKSELGFNPRYSDLETIVKTAWEWHKKNAKLKTPAKGDARQRRQDSK